MCGCTRACSNLDDSPMPNVFTLDAKDVLSCRYCSLKTIVSSILNTVDPSDLRVTWSRKGLEEKDTT